MGQHRILIAVALFVASTASHGVGFQVLHLDEFVNFWPGFDQSYDDPLGPPVDDVSWDPVLASDLANQFPGQPLNPSGATGSFHATDPLFAGPSGDGLLMGYFTGFWSSVGSQLVVGPNALTGLSTPFDVNVFEPYGNGNDIDEIGNPTVPVALNAPGGVNEFVPGLPHTTTIFPGNFLASDYYYRDPLFPESVTHLTGLGGGYLLPGQDPNVLFPVSQG